MNKEVSKTAYKLWSENKGLEAGKIIFEEIPQNKRPLWASNILSECLKLNRSIPEFITIINTARNSAEWENAHDVFQSDRKLTLLDEKSRSKDLVFRGILFLAENTAKVSYNATNSDTSFDHDSGWWIIQNLKYIVDKVNNSDFEKRILKTAFEFEVNE